MKADLGRQMTDKKLKELENKIKKIYSEAEVDLKKKMDDHFRLFEKKDKIKRDQLLRKVITKQEYDSWRIGQMAVGARWQAMLQNISDDLANYEKIAKSIANGYMPDVYALNMNYSTYDLEKQLGLDTSFTLYNRESVEQIIRDEPELLPEPGRLMNEKIASGAAERWRKGHIQSVVVQSILQGESVPNMATRIAGVLCVGDRKAAIRYARTAVTGAENAGRMDSFHRMEDLGIKMKKTWLAVLDGRTRDAHRELDGQTIPVDKPFHNSIGKIMYPGDPTAHGANLWNCRCTMISQVEGFERDVSDLSMRNTSKLNGMSYDEWKEEHGKSQSILMPDAIAKIMRGRYARDYKK